MFIDNEYNYFAWNSIRIIEGLDSRGSDNQGSTVLKKQDRDYYWGVKVARVAESSNANNGHHALLLESSASSKC